MPEFRNIGGQAVIEGVMMRSPVAYAVAVRRPDGSISVLRKDYVAFTARHWFWRLPFVRGVVVLLESLTIGMRALSFSADEAMQDEEREEARRKRERRGRTRERLLLAGTLVLSFGLGLVIFFWVPLQLSHVLTGLLGTDSGIVFNLIDGVIRLVFLLVYIWVISLWGEIKRIFEYHGAEHKSIFTYEADQDLLPENASGQSRFHPRCGTSFLLTVVLVSIVVFTFLGRPDSIVEKLIRFAFIPVIGGISYEFLRLAGQFPNSSWMRPMVMPGLWLQRITTNEPDRDQLEVALHALKEVLPDAQDAEHRRLAAEIWDPPR